MKRYLSRVLLLVIALLIVACANTTLTKPTTSTPQITQTSGESENASPLEQPATAGAITVHVTLIEFRILSTLKVFHAGSTYYFVITNRGQDVHEFKVLPDKPDGTPQSAEVQYKDTLIELEPIMPGTTWTVNFKFSTAGRFEFACQMGRHYMAGMRLPIIVAS
jgi:uncharacterized cupredoxin-like copper-binding protein